MTILNETIVKQPSDYIKIIVIISGIITIISIALYMVEIDWSCYGIIFGLAIMCFFLIGLFVPSLQEPIATDYQVIFTEDIDMNQFYEQYEIIDQDGKIFTIREYFDK